MIGWPLLPSWPPLLGWPLLQSPYDPAMSWGFSAELGHINNGVVLRALVPWCVRGVYCSSLAAAAAASSAGAMQGPTSDYLLHVSHVATGLVIAALIQVASSSRGGFLCWDRLNNGVTPGDVQGQSMLHHSLQDMHIASGDGLLGQISLVFSLACMSSPLLHHGGGQPWKDFRQSQSVRSQCALLPTGLRTQRC